MNTNYELLKRMGTEKIKAYIKELKDLLKKYKKIKAGEKVIIRGTCRLCEVSELDCNKGPCPWIVFERHGCMQHTPRVSLVVCACYPEKNKKAIDFRIESIPLWITELEQELARREED